MTDVTLGCALPAGVAESADARVSKTRAVANAPASPLFAADPAATHSPAADNGLRTAGDGSVRSVDAPSSEPSRRSFVANSVATPPVVAGGQGRSQEEICDSAASIVVTAMVALVVAIVLCAATSGGAT